MTERIKNHVFEYGLIKDYPSFKTGQLRDRWFWNHMFEKEKVSLSCPPEGYVSKDSCLTGCERWCKRVHPDGILHTREIEATRCDNLLIKIPNNNDEVKNIVMQLTKMITNKSKETKI